MALFCSKKLSILLRAITLKRHGEFYCLNCLYSFRTRNGDGWANNSETSSTTKIGEHIPCGYSMSTIWAFDNIENKHTLYCGEDCMKKFCTSLGEYEKKKMLPWRAKCHTKTQKHVIFVENES